MPKSGEFVLGAQTSREVQGNTEAYFWIVAHSLGGRDQGQVLLSNDNQVGAYQSPSIVESLKCPPIEESEHAWKRTSNQTSEPI